MIKLLLTFFQANKPRYRPRRTFSALCLLITVIFYIIAAANTAKATTYYLDAVNGNDSNPGTSSQPWKTMARAMQNSASTPKVIKGDTVYLRSGNYGDIDFSFDPTTPAEHPESWSEKILYKNDTGHTPVFTWLGFGYRKPRYLEFDGINITRPEEIIRSGKECIYERGASSLRFKNMKMTGYWETETATASGKMTATGIAISTPDWSVVRDILIENCEITQVQRGIQINQCIVGTGIVIRNNTIHKTSNSGIMIEREIPTDSNNGTVTIEGNNIYNEESVLSYHRITYDINRETGTFVNNDLCTQDITGAKGLYYNYSPSIIFISPTQLTPAWEVGTGKNIRDQVNDGVISDPCAIVLTDYSHASGLAITADKVVIRGNLIRSFGGSFPIGLYPDDTKFPDGFTDLLIENNLVYDSVAQHPVTLDAVGGSAGVDANVIIRNNTIIGTHIGSAHDGYYFGGGLTILPKANKNGNGVKIYGNIIVGILTLSYESQVLSAYDEDYNIIYSSIYQSNWMTFLKGNHTTIYSNGSNQPISAFISGFFVDPNYYGHGTNYTHYPADGGPSNVVSDYQLKSGSPAINFGNATYAPLSDILGNSRDSSPDAGCYEYVSGSQSYTLSLTADHGTVTKSPNKTGYSSGETVTLQATPNTGYHFVNWTGDASGTSDSATITMNSNKSVTANFAINTYTLTITATNGSVTKTPDKSSYNYGESVTLAATANTGYHFSNWSGDASGTSSTTAIVMNSNKSVTANFSINTYSLSITSSNGSATKTPDKTGYNYGEQVTLQAVPATGYHFSSWSGNASGTSSSTTITMNANKSVTANFAINTYTLDITAVFGSVTKSPNKTLYNYGETVSLRAVPNSGYDFTGWAGGASGSSNPVSLTMDSNKSVAANFAYTFVDNNAPSIAKSRCYPLPNAIQVPLNTLLVIHIVDEGRGIDANTVSIEVNNNIIYTGNVSRYDSVYGRCNRTGNIARFIYIYQPYQSFDFDQSVTVAASAADLADNQMSDSYSFRTEMLSFGKNLKVNSGTDSLADGQPATLRDSSGNIWAAWQKGNVTSRDIYISKLTAGNGAFETSIQLTNDVSDQCSPAIAKDSTDKLYVVWQDNRRGNWDIYLSTSVDGINWSAGTRITDSNANQVNPAIAIDRSSPNNKVYVAWQDDQNINQDIFVATSTNSFLTKTIYQVTTDNSDQTEPTIVTDAANTAYIFWTDLRGGSKDIYGAASTGGLWSNVAIVTGSGDQSEPAVAAEATGATLHLLWVNNSSGNRDIFYASCSGSLHALSGDSIIDGHSGADQPSISVTGSTGNNLKVFACWRDKRNTDTDLYFVQIGSGSGTNILVEDNGTGAEQSTPVIGIDESGYPYLLWVDDRNTNADIFYAGSTHIQTTPLFAQNVSMASETTIGKGVSAITNQDDISVVIPAGTYLCDVNITGSKIENPPNLSITFLSALYEFGPSGITFDQPVTLIIPYIASGSNSRTIYWYDILTAAASQEGVTNVEDITIFGTLHAIRFKTDHFTPFFVGSGGSSGSSSGGGGGGCSLAPPGKNGNIIGFVLPFLALGLVITVIKRRDRQNHKRLISKINKV